MSDAKSVVQSVAKTFAVLGAFTVDTPELTISEVGERAALDFSVQPRSLGQRLRRLFGAAPTLQDWAPRL